MHYLRCTVLGQLAPGYPGQDGHGGAVEGEEEGIGEVARALIRSAFSTHNLSCSRIIA